MSQCDRCGSYAINHHCHGRDGSDGDLCDVCYWRKRAERQPLTDEFLWKILVESPNEVIRFARSIVRACETGEKQ